MIGGHHYDLEVELLPESDELRGVARITFINPTASILSAVPMRVPQAVGEVTRRLPSGGRPKKVSVRTLSATRVEAPLDPALEPGGTTLIEAEFRTAYSADPHSWGYRIAGGAWHPKIVAYCDGRFVPEEEQADCYRVTLTAPSDEVIATSGQAQNKIAGQNGKSTTVHTARGITNFGIASSSRFLKHQLHTEAVAVASYYFDGGAERAARLASHASRSAAWYRELLGSYPQPVLSIIPGSHVVSGGTPFASNMIVIHDAPDGLDLPGLHFEDWLLAHEIAHQYWGYDGVLDSQAEQHWLGLGLGLCMDRWYCEQYNPASLLRHRSLLKLYMEAASSGADTRLVRPTEEWASIAPPARRLVNHCKSYAVMQLLEHMVGRRAFVQLLCKLQQAFRHAHLSVGAFQATAELVTGKRLGRFFEDWILRAHKACYEINSVRERGDAVIVNVVNSGAAEAPVDVELALRDGARTRMPVSASALSSEVELFRPGQSEVQFVRLDPDGRVPFANRFETRCSGSGFVTAEIDLPPCHWHTNTSAIRLMNADIRAHRISITIESSNRTRISWSSIHTAPPGRSSVEREFYLQPFPGTAKLKVWIVDLTDDMLAYFHVFDVEYQSNSCGSNFRLPGHSLHSRRILPAWKEFKEGCFTTYVLADDSYSQEHRPIIERDGNRALANLKARLHPEFVGPVSLYLFPSNTYRVLYTGYRGTSCVLPGNVLLAVLNETETPDLEYALSLVLLKDLGSPPRWWSEALALLHSRNHSSQLALPRERFRALAQREALFPVSRLLLNDEVWAGFAAPELARAQTLSLVEFLIETCGMEKVLTACRQLKAGRPQENRERFGQIFGATTQEIEAAWLNELPLAAQDV